MQMKMYIAGKITGVPNFQEKFKEAQLRFEKMGYVVLNPAELPGGMTQRDYMQLCFAMIDAADIIHFLPCHVDSKGAQLELKYAEYTGKHIQYDINF